MARIPRRMLDFFLGLLGFFWEQFTSRIESAFGREPAEIIKADFTDRHFLKPSDLHIDSNLLAAAIYREVKNKARRTMNCEAGSWFCILLLT